MTWRLFWIVLAGVVTSAVGFLPAAYGLDAVLAGGLAAAISGGLALGAMKAVMVAPALLGYNYDERTLIGRWVAVAIAVHWVWTVAVSVRPDLWWAWLAALCGLAAIEYAAAAGFIYYVTRVKPTAAAVAEQRHERSEQHQQDQVLRTIRAALVGAELDWLRLDQRWVKLPRESGIQFTLRVPPRAEVMSKGGKAAVKSGLSAGDTAEALAIAFSQVLGVDLDSQWVQVRKERGAGAYTVTVLLWDVIAEVIPYVDPVDAHGVPVATSITEPALVGYRVDGDERRRALKAHSQDVGKTGSGKSSLMHVKLAHRTRCSDVVHFVCGTEKVYDLVGPWLEPYEGTDEAPPILWVANGPEDMAEMLAAAMRIARYRQSCRMNERGGWPTVVVTLTEASFALQHPKARAYFDGHPHHATDLAAMIMRGAFSGDVILEVDSQRSTQDQWGDKGGDVSTNMGSSTIFRSNDAAEVGRITGDYQLPMPLHKGEYWLVADEELPEKIKAPYIQQDDPSKQKLHEGSTISDIAWSRRLLPSVQLDPGSAQAAGESFRARHTRVTPAYIEYLTGAAAPAASSQSPAEVQRAEAAEVLSRVLPALNAAEPAAEPPEADEVAEIVGPLDEPSPVVSRIEEAGGRTRADRILRLVTAADAPVSRQHIAEGLRADGDTVGDQVLTNALNKLVTDGRLTRPERGMYAPAESTTEGEQTNKQTGLFADASRARA